MRSFPLKAIISAFMISATRFALAQSAHWEPPGGTLPVGEASSLQLVFDGCEPKDTPAPPRVPGLTLQYSGQTSSISIINGSYSHTTGCSFTALLNRKQGVDIPAFEVETNKGRVKVASAHFDPVGATVGGGDPLDSAAHSRLEARPPAVWAGEVFNLDYTIQAARGYYPDFGRGAFDWTPDPLIVEDWSAPESFEDRAASGPEIGLVRHTRALAHKPGSYRLNPVNQIVNLSVGVTGFGFFQQRQYQQFSVSSAVPTVEVRPLPPAPSGFGGAVGAFTLSSKVVPQNPSVGDPVTWTVQLSGTGNWPDIAGLSPRQVSRDFQVIQPKAKRTHAEGKLFEGSLSEDVVLVPTKSGTYTLDPVHFIFFNPKTGQYETLTAPGSTVKVSAEAVAESATQPASASVATSGATPPGPAAPAPPSAVPPSGLPKDPIPTASPASRPWSARTFGCLLAAPLAAVLAAWGAFAFRRSRLTDPEKRRREARARLAAVIEKLGSADAGESARGLLLDWQREAAVVWRLSQAVPTPASIGDGAWSSLWSESERAIYGRVPALPRDWTTRAAAALAAKSVPGYRLAQVFMPRNLFPFLFASLLAALGLLSCGLIAASEFGIQPSPESAYRQGDFAGAEKGWRDELSRQPLSWTSRHNLSLALGQQDHWDEGAAQAVAAFVQRPDNPAVRWQFALACEKAGAAPEPLAAFLPPGLLRSVAWLSSPSDWQRYAVASAWLTGAGLIALLACAFGTAASNRRRVAFSLAVVALGLAGAGVSASCWKAFGTLGDPDAGIVWRSSTLRSIPTEADSSQKTTPVGAGSLARLDKRFLGWVRLAFDNGQTGWVRKDEVVWLWQ